MSLRRRGTAAVGLAVAAALSLSACGSGDGGSDGSAKSDVDKKAAVATGGKDFGDAAKKTAAYGTDAKAGQFPRTLTHAMGKTEIKSAPKRVVVLDVGEFDNVVSLGVKPVGYALRGRRGHSLVPEEGRGRPQERRHDQQPQP